MASETYDPFDVGGDVLCRDFAVVFQGFLRWVGELACVHVPGQ